MAESQDVSRERGTGAALRPVTVRRAVDEVADRLLTAIALGEISVGERLPPERDMAEGLEVSRTTVRAAVGRLHELGCLEVVRGRTGGHYVRHSWGTGSAAAVRRTLTSRWEHIRELLDTRRLAESLIARTAAERRTPEDVEAIGAALAGYEAADGPAATRDADHTLHLVVARAAHNARLLTWSRELLAEINQGFPIEPFRGRLVGRALADHRALARAVVDGDADGAARIAMEHFTITELNLRSVIEDAAPDRIIRGS